MKNTFAPAARRPQLLAAAAALLSALAIATPALAGSAIGATPEDLGIANGVQAGGGRGTQDRRVRQRREDGHLQPAQSSSGLVAVMPAEHMALASNVQAALMKERVFQASRA